VLTIRMSSSGYCERRLSAMLLGRDGISPPRWLSESADEGNWHETRMKDELRKLGCVVTDEQRELTLNEEGYKEVGHIDGNMLISPAVLSSPLFTIHYIDCSPTDVDFQAPHLLEVKTFSFLEHQRWISEGWDNYFKTYACQHTMYRTALGDKLSFLATKDRSGGARNLYIIGKDPVDIIELRTKLANVVKYVEQGDLVPASFNHESLECRRCSYRASQCMPKLIPVDETDVVTAAHDYRDGRQQEKEGKALAEEARDLLKAYAKKKQLTQWTTIDGLVVSYSSFPREDISIKGLSAFMPREQFEEAITRSQVEKITVTDSRRED
jgi:hypothetical protein